MGQLRWIHRTSFEASSGFLLTFLLPPLTAVLTAVLAALFVLSELQSIHQYV